MISHRTDYFASNYTSAITVIWWKGGEKMKRQIMKDALLVIGHLLQIISNFI